jgi:hypothetical protein
MTRLLCMICNSMGFCIIPHTKISEWEEDINKQLKEVVESDIEKWNKVSTKANTTRGIIQDIIDFNRKF